MKCTSEPQVERLESSGSEAKLSPGTPRESKANDMQFTLSGSSAIAILSGAK